MAMPLVGGISQDLSTTFQGVGNVLSGGWNLLGSVVTLDTQGAIGSLGQVLSGVGQTTVGSLGAVLRTGTNLVALTSDVVGGTKDLVGEGVTYVAPSVGNSTPSVVVGKGIDLALGTVDALTQMPIQLFDLVVGNTPSSHGQQSIQASQEWMTSVLDDPQTPQTAKAIINDIGGESLESGSQALERLGGGAHIVLDDGGAHFAQWVQLGGVSGDNLVDRTHASSHYKTDDPRRNGDNPTQYGIDLPMGKGHLLFGTRMDLTVDPPQVQTWVQAEKHGTSMKELVPHLNDFVIHKITGKQVGPSGLIENTEKPRDSNYLTTSEVVIV